MTGTLYFPSFWQKVQLSLFSTQSQGRSRAVTEPRRREQEQLRLNTKQILSFSSENPQPLHPRQAAGTARKPQPAHEQVSKSPHIPRRGCPRQQTPPRGEPGSQLHLLKAPSPVPVPAPRVCPEHPCPALLTRTPSSAAAAGRVRKKVSACPSRFQPCAGAHSSVATLPVPPSAG